MDNEGNNDNGAVFEGAKLLFKAGNDRLILRDCSARKHSQADLCVCGFAFSGRRYATMATGFRDALTARYDAGAFRNCEETTGENLWRLTRAFICPRKVDKGSRRVIANNEGGDKGSNFDDTCQLSFFLTDDLINIA